MSITVTIADDHPLLLSGTQHFLETKGYTVLATATDGNTAFYDIVKHLPDIAILDFDIPKLNGIEIANLCLQKALKTKLIILTLYKEEAIIKEVGHSIQGYILKDDAINELELCIIKVFKGHTYKSKNLKTNIHLSNPDASIETLTITEKKILRYLVKDQSSSQIAEALIISKRTVEKHRSNIIKKLGITSSQNALLLWVKKNPEVFNT